MRPIPTWPRQACEARRSGARTSACLGDPGRSACRRPAANRRRPRPVRAAGCALRRCRRTSTARARTAWPSPLPTQRLAVHRLAHCPSAARPRGHIGGGGNGPRLRMPRPRPDRSPGGGRPPRCGRPRSAAGTVERTPAATTVISHGRYPCDAVSTPWSCTAQIAQSPRNRTPTSSSASPTARLRVAPRRSTGSFALSRITTRCWRASVAAVSQPIEPGTDHDDVSHRFGGGCEGLHPRGSRVVVRAIDARHGRRDRSQPGRPHELVERPVHRLAAARWRDRQHALHQIDVVDQAVDMVDPLRRQAPPVREQRRATVLERALRERWTVIRQARADHHRRRAELGKPARAGDSRRPRCPPL